jgi:peptide/nickel transport system substrate-binding protein
MRNLRQRLLAAIAAFALAAPALAQDTRPALTIAVQDVPRSLDPLTQFGNVDWRGYANIFDGLLTMDFAGDFRPLPALAESWRRIDGRTLELTLRRDVTFHDGSKLTAEDIAFTFGPERMRNEGAPGFAVGRIFFGTFAHVEVVDAHTVRIVTNQDDPLIEQRLGTIPGGVVGQQAFRAAPNFAAWNQHAIGTGPYRVQSYRSGNELVLVAHEGWWGGRPPAQRLRFWAVPEVASRVAALRSGEVQIATDIPPDQFPVVAADARLEIVGGGVANHRVLSYNARNPALRDPRIRQALNLAIDREAIIRALWDNRLPVTRSHQFPAYRDLFLADWPMPRHDPAAARRLLAEAGYRGERITYNVLSNYYTNELATAQVLVEMWRDVGLNVVLEVRENYSQIVNDPAHGIRNWSNTMALPDPVGNLWRLNGPRGPVQGSYREWANADFNRDGAILETSTDTATRQAAWRRMLAIYDTEDSPGTVLHQFGLFYGKRRDVAWQPLPVEWMDFRPAFLRTAAR